MFFITFFLFFSSGLVFSQNLTQTVRGVVIDRDSRSPLWGANVVVLDTDPLKGSSTDSAGQFRIENISVGRQSLKVSFLGYDELIIPDLLINSGKEVFINLELQESYIRTGEVTITAAVEKEKPMNSMAVISARTFSIEESNRYAGGFNDLSRMTQAFAGVSSYNGETNEIVIRGNSPRGLLWRIEGIEIPNPNHFPQGEGSSGGGISIITADMISNSDFFSGAFPAEYGNALSGVFDIHLRKGNNNCSEYTLKTGAIGVEAMIEGPFVKKKQASYLLQYRYSTLALLKRAGLEIVDNTVIPTFQDMTFHLFFPMKKGASLSVFSINGLSNVVIKAKKDSANWQSRSDRIEQNDTYLLSIAGVKYSKPFSNNKTFLHLIFSHSTENNNSVSDSLGNDYSFYPITENRFRYNTERVSLMINHKLNVKNTLRTGCIFSMPAFDIRSQGEIQQDQTGSSGLIIGNSGTTGMDQIFFQWKNRIGSSLTVNSGLHGSYFLLNGNSSLEPRTGIRWQVHEKHALSAGIGLHSKTEALSVYFTEFENNAYRTMPNKNIDFIRALHNVMGYDYSIGKNVRLKLEAYYQYLYNVPIENSDSGWYSMLNYKGGFCPYSLVNKGTGKNYGLELTLEKFYSNQYYFLFTGSLFDSKYKAGNGVIYNTVFNCHYVANVLAGKEIMLGKNRNNLTGASIKFILRGGNRYTPVDLEKSIAENRPVYIEDKRFEEKSPDYILFDFGLYYRKNSHHFSWIVSLDIQNILNRKNIITQYYDPELRKIKYVYGLPLIPVLNVKAEF